MTGGTAVLIKKDGAVNNNIQQSAVFGQPSGFKAADHFILMQAANALKGLRFRTFRDKWYFFAFQFLKLPAKNAFKSRVQIRHCIVQIKNKNRDRHKFKKGPVTLFGLAALLGQLQCAGFRFTQRFLGDHPIGNVSGNPSETDWYSVIIRY